MEETDCFPQRGIEVWETSKGRNHEVDGKLLTLLFLILLLHPFLSAQTQLADNLLLPPQETLETALETFYDAERNAQLKAFDSGKQGDWKDLLPTVGIGYTVSNQPRPTVHWNPISIFDRKDAKRKQQLQRQSIILQYENLITDKLFKLRQLIADYDLDLQELDLKQKTLILDERLYAIELEKYEQSLIKPSEYFKEEKKILTARATLLSFQNELLKRRSAILYAAKNTGN